MPGVYCYRCGTNVILEQDGETCSNHGGPIVFTIAHQPEPTDTPPPPTRKTRKLTRKTAARSAA